MRLTLNNPEHYQIMHNYKVGVQIKCCMCNLYIVTATPHVSLETLIREAMEHERTNHTRRTIKVGMGDE